MRGFVRHVLVNYVSGDVNGSAQMVYFDKSRNNTVEGVEYDYAKMRDAMPVIGRWFTRQEIQSRRQVAIIGTAVVSELFGNEDPVGKTIKISRINVTIIGLASPKGFARYRDQDDAVLVSVSTAMHRLLGSIVAISLVVDGIGIVVGMGVSVMLSTFAEWAVKPLIVSVVLIGNFFFEKN